MSNIYKKTKYVPNEASNIQSFIQKSLTSSMSSYNFTVNNQSISECNIAMIDNLSVKHILILTIWKSYLFIWSIDCDSQYKYKWYRDSIKQNSTEWLDSSLTYILYTVTEKTKRFM